MNDRRIKDTIRTEATLLDGPLPETEFALGATVADYEAGGAAAGETVGLAYKANYGPGSNADVSKFPSALRDALFQGCRRMRSSAAGVDDIDAKIHAWRESFLRAARQHIPDIDEMAESSKMIDGVVHIKL